METKLDDYLIRRKLRYIRGLTAENWLCIPNAKLTKIISAVHKPFQNAYNYYADMGRVDAELNFMACKIVDRRTEKGIESDIFIQSFTKQNKFGGILHDTTSITEVKIDVDIFRELLDCYASWVSEHKDLSLKTLQKMKWKIFQENQTERDSMERLAYQIK